MFLRLCSSGISPIDQEEVNLFEFSKASNIDVYNVTVDTGDMIYVPEGWFHQVSYFWAQLLQRPFPAAVCYCRICEPSLFVTLLKLSAREINLQVI